jgi:hypothetical protein
MNVETNALIPAIVSYLSERTVNVSKTKLLKLLYLFDVEFYREHGMTFTGFEWKFFHLGPWTAEFENLLTTLTQRGLLSEVPFSAKGYDGTVLRTEQTTSLRSAVGNLADELTLSRILNDWGNQPTGRLLDHVYFQTEPMEHGVRNHLLDFSVILAERPGLYRRSSSSASPGLIAKRKREFQKKIDEQKRGGPSQEGLTMRAPRYDEEFVAAMNTLERLRTS